jgi:hypothetical protein
VPDPWEAIASGELSGSGVAARLDRMDPDEVIGLFGEPVRVTRYAEVLGHWRVGQPRPALADDDPAVMQAIGRCAATRIRDPRLVLASVHRASCGWCGFPLQELLAACDWAVVRSRYVVVDLMVWRGEDGSIYLRDTRRSGIYEEPAWSVFWALPAGERGRRIRAVVERSRDGLAA